MLLEQMLILNISDKIKVIKCSRPAGSVKEGKESAHYPEHHKNSHYNKKNTADSIYHRVMLLYEVKGTFEPVDQQGA